MGWWIELRCDVHGPKCWSGQNDGPMALSESSVREVYKTVAHLHTAASERGWKNYKRHRLQGWACPACANEAGVR